MSVDFNSMINKALSESQQRRAIGNSAKFIDVDNVSKAYETKTGGELSTEAITNAMKAGRLKREEDNNFISTNGNSFKVNRAKEDKEENILSPMTMRAQENIVNMQTKISAIQEHADIAVDRQNNVAQSLRSIQKDPFIK